MGDTRVDIVVAVRNEEENIPRFVHSVREAGVPAPVRLGIVFVEDSSTDNTLGLLRELSRSDPAVTFYSLREGHGQTAAIAFGMQRSAADAVIMMDVDGGHPVDILPDMVRRFVEGAEIVQAIRTKSEERRCYRNPGSYLFNVAFRVISGVDTGKQNVYYRLVSKRVKQIMLSNPRWLHFLRINISPRERAGIQYVFFAARNREFGQSKYALLRLTRMALVAPLSVMSVGRAIGLLSGVAATAAVSFLAGHVLGGAVLSGLGLLVAGQFWKMSTEDVLAKLEVKEHGSVGA